MKLKNNKNYNSAFTLVELSIVLVIIGLLIGGILVGREMIKNSEIRATIGQLEKYNTAVHAFQLKYNAIPGDIMSSHAAALGFYNVTGASANKLAYGNGDYVVQGYPDAPWSEGGTFGGEIVMFFLHLSQAKLIDGMYGAGGQTVQIVGATPTGGSYAGLPKVSVAVSGFPVGEILPAAKLGNGNYFTIGSLSSKNYFIITGAPSLDLGFNINPTNNISPIEAYTIDKKIDDGLPYTGVVYAIDTETTPLSASNGDGVGYYTLNNCVNSSAYYTSNKTYSNSRLCSLRIVFQ
jgi:prepilin-type N-terminal cleavage/methylation domain-containing protein